MVIGVTALVTSSLMPAVVSAAQITARKVVVSSSSPSAATATTTYSFNFTVPTTGTAIKSLSAVACTTSIGACTTPTSFTSASSNLSSQPVNLGAAAGWTVSTATAGELRILNAANATNPSSTQTVIFGNVQNTTVPNATVYLRINTFSDAAWTTVVDTGTVAMSTSDLITVNADVAESLVFTTGNGLGGGTCANIAATPGTVTLAPNPLSTGSTSTGTSYMCAATNATSGFNIQYLAGNFAAGAVNFANGYGVGGSAAVTGTEEFGLKAALTSGTGGTVTAPYAAGNYAFNPTVATNLASAAAPLTENVFTVTYSANVANTTKPGSYSSVFNYVCTGQF